jgi:hypothetical protein
MKANVPSGSIQNGSIYSVNGTGTVTYNGTTYSVGQTFTGVAVTTYTTTLSPLVYQVLAIQEIVVEEIIRADDITYPERVNIQEIVIEEELINSFSDKVNLFGITIEEQLYAGGSIIWIS